MTIMIMKKKTFTLGEMILKTPTSKVVKLFFSLQF